MREICKDCTFVQSDTIEYMEGTLNMYDNIYTTETGTSLYQEMCNVFIAYVERGRMVQFTVFKKTDKGFKYDSATYFKAYYIGDTPLSENLMMTLWHNSHCVFNIRDKVCYKKSPRLLQASLTVDDVDWTLVITNGLQLGNEQRQKLLDAAAQRVVFMPLPFGRLPNFYYVGFPTFTHDTLDKFLEFVEDEILLAATPPDDKSNIASVSDQHGAHDIFFIIGTYKRSDIDKTRIAYERRKAIVRFVHLIYERDSFKFKPCKSIYFDGYSAQQITDYLEDASASYVVMNPQLNFNFKKWHPPLGEDDTIMIQGSCPEYQISNLQNAYKRRGLAVNLTVDANGMYNDNPERLDVTWYHLRLGDDTERYHKNAIIISNLDEAKGNNVGVVITKPMDTMLKTHIEAVKTEYGQAGRYIRFAFPKGFQTGIATKNTGIIDNSFNELHNRYVQSTDKHRFILENYALFNMPSNRWHELVGYFLENPTQIPELKEPFLFPAEAARKIAQGTWSFGDNGLHTVPKISAGVWGELTDYHKNESVAKFQPKLKILQKCMFTEVNGGHCVIEDSLIGIIKRLSKGVDPITNARDRLTGPLNRLAFSCDILNIRKYRPSESDRQVLSSLLYPYEDNINTKLWTSMMRKEGHLIADIGFLLSFVATLPWSIHFIMYDQWTSPKTVFFYQYDNFDSYFTSEDKKNELIQNAKKWHPDDDDVAKIITQFANAFFLIRTVYRNFCEKHNYDDSTLQDHVITMIVEEERSNFFEELDEISPEIIERVFLERKITWAELYFWAKPPTDHMILNRVRQGVWQIVVSPEGLFNHKGSGMLTLPQLELPQLGSWIIKDTDMDTEGTILEFYQGTVGKSTWNIHSALWGPLTPSTAIDFIQNCISFKSKDLEASIIMNMQVQFTDIYMVLLGRALRLLGIYINAPDVDPSLDTKRSKGKLDSAVLMGLITSMIIMVKDKRLLSMATSYLLETYLSDESAEYFLARAQVNAHPKAPLRFDFAEPGICRTLDRISPDLFHTPFSDIIGTKCSVLTDQVKMAILTDVIAPKLHWRPLFYLADITLAADIKTLNQLFFKERPTFPVVVVTLTAPLWQPYTPDSKRNNDSGTVERPYRCLLLFHKHNDDEWVEFFNPCNVQYVSAHVKHALDWSVQDKTFHPTWGLSDKMSYYEMIIPDRGAIQCTHTTCQPDLFGYVSASVNNDTSDNVGIVSDFVNSPMFTSREIDRTLFAIAYRWMSAYGDQVKQTIIVEHAGLVKEYIEQVKRQYSDQPAIQTDALSNESAEARKKNVVAVTNYVNKSMDMSVGPMMDIASETVGTDFRIKCSKDIKEKELKSIQEFRKLPQVVTSDAVIKTVKPNALPADGSPVEAVPPAAVGNAVPLPLPVEPEAAREEVPLHEWVHGYGEWDDSGVDWEELP